MTDIQSAGMNAIPFPIRSLSGTTIDQCLFEEIPQYWEANDIITFLADLRMDHTLLSDHLDNREKEQEKKFKTEYFKKRFTVSRSLLKRILQSVVGADNPTDILLSKEKKGRVIMPCRPDICISLSYSGPYIAISIGKQKIGCDIEVVRPVKTKKIESSPVFINYNCSKDGEHLHRVIHMWTIIESYAKLYDKNPYPLLNSCSLSENANFVSYCVDNHMIFSLASEKIQFTDTLVWLDPSGLGKASNIPSGISGRYGAGYKRIR
jgi:4'-phosphopantetheinyl transferase